MRASREALILTILSMTLPTPFVTLLGRPVKSKDDSKNIKGQINVNSLLEFH